MTFIEDYFLEELLYAPEEELENSQELRLIIFTLYSKDLLRNHGVDTRETVSDLMPENCKEDKDLHYQNDAETTSVCPVSVMQPDCKISHFNDVCSKSQPLKTGPNVKSELVEQKSKFNIDLKERTKITTEMPYSNNERQKIGNWDTLSSVKTLLSSGIPYILDIDMDFFSTRNPFKDLFTKVNSIHYFYSQCLCYDSPFKS